MPTHRTYSHCKQAYCHVLTNSRHTCVKQECQMTDLLLHDAANKKKHLYPRFEQTYRCVKTNSRPTRVKQVCQMTQILMHKNKRSCSRYGQTYCCIKTNSRPTRMKQERQLTYYGQTYCCVETNSRHTRVMQEHQSTHDEQAYCRLKRTADLSCEARLSLDRHALDVVVNKTRHSYPHFKQIHCRVESEQHALLVRSKSTSSYVNSCLPIKQTPSMLNNDLS